MINFIFIDTVLAGLFFVDKGQCTSYTTKASCLQTKSLDQMDSICVWSADDVGLSGAKCSFNDETGATFLASLVLTSVISIAAAPFDAIINFIVDEVRNCIVSKVVNVRRQSTTAPDMERNQELKALESHKVLLMLAARVRKMRVTLDQSSVDDEVNALLVYEKSEKRWFRFDSHTTIGRHSALRQWIDDTAQKMASHVVSKHQVHECEVLRRRVRSARQAEVSMVKAMNALKSDAYKEMYLYQVFFLIPSCCVCID